MISVIVPCKNRIEALSECIESINDSIDNAKKTFTDLETEIIIINDHSEDGFTEKVLNKFKHVKIFDSDGTGPGYARNLGISKSNGDYIFFTDSDCVVSKDWITNGYRAFRETDEVVIQGIPWLFQENVNAEYGKSEGMLYRIMFSTYVKGRYTSMTDSRNLLLNKNIVEKLGREVFSEKQDKATAESRVFGKKCISNGINILFDENIKIYHEDPINMKAVCKQKYRHGYGRVMIWEKRPAYDFLADRYFDNPINNGIDKDYILPAHASFLLGYYKNINDNEEYNRFMQFIKNIFEKYNKQIEMYPEFMELIRNEY